MKTIKHLLILLLLTTTAGQIQTGYDGDVNDSSFEIADPKDRADKERKELIAKLHQKVEAAKVEKVANDLKVNPNPKSNWLTKQFDKVSDWSNKKTLNKFFTDHAKNDSTEGPDFLDKNHPNENTMWNNLSAKDQHELIDNWSEAHNKKVNDSLEKDHKKYKETLESYDKQDKKETLAKVNSSEAEIKKIEIKIQNIDAKLNSTPSETRRKTLIREKSNLEKLITTHKAIVDDYLNSIKEELNNREFRNKDNQKIILQKNLEKLKNFIKTINNLDGSEFNLSLDATNEKKSEPSSQLTNESVTESTEEKLAEIDNQPNTNEPDASENFDASNSEDLTQEQIKNLTDAEITERINAIVDQNPGSFNYDPEYIKLDNEEKLRSNNNSTKTKSLESFWKTLDHKNESMNSEDTSKLPIKNNDSKKTLERVPGNWNNNEIIEAIKSNNYTKQATDMLIAELPENLRSQFQQ